MPKNDTVPVDRNYQCCGSRPFWIGSDYSFWYGSDFSFLYGSGSQLFQLLCQRVRQGLANSHIFHYLFITGTSFYLMGVNNYFFSFKRVTHGTEIGRSSYTFPSLGSVFMSQKISFKHFKVTQTCERGWNRQQNHQKLWFCKLFIYKKLLYEDRTCLIGQRMMRVNFKADRGDWRADSANTCHHPVKKIPWEVFRVGWWGTSNAQ